MNLSIIIPFFNEQSRFSKTVKYIRDFLDTQKFFDDIELIFVDDGSTDNTRGLIDEFAKQISIKTIAYKKNMGKGYAVRQGMMAAKSDYALFLDADMSTEPEEIEKFMAEIKKGTPVIIGSRRSKGSQVLVSQSLHRTMMGMIFTMLANLIMGMRVPDFTCGFKCFSRRAGEAIFPTSLINRWSFDAEILFLAKLKGLEIATVPVAWKNDSVTTVPLGRDAIESFFDLIKIRWNYVLGRYN